MEKKSRVSAENKPRIYEIVAAITTIIEAETGVNFLAISSKSKYNSVHQARLLFAGVLSSYGVQPGKIAQLTYKKTEIIESLISEFDAKLKKSEYFQQIITTIKESFK